MTIFDDLEDPYQMNNIDYKTHPELFATLREMLKGKLEEADDIWYRDGILDKLNFQDIR